MLSTSRFYKLFLILIVLTMAISACSLFSGGESPAADQDVATAMPSGDVATAPPAAAASSAIASVTEMTGAVQVTSRSTGTSSLAFIGQQLEAGDGVSTSVDSRARVDFANGTFVRMGPNSQTEIISVDTSPRDGFLARLSLKAGEVWIVLTGGELIIDTPSGVASVRGSYMSVDYNPLTGEITVTCLEGECHLWNSAGGVIMYAGQMGVIKASNQPVIWGLMTDADVQWWLQNNPEASVILPAVTATVQAYGNIPFLQDALAGTTAAVATAVPSQTLPLETCIIGTWDVYPESIRTYMVVALEVAGLGNVSPTVEGSGTVIFAKDGVVTANGGYTVDISSSVGNLAGPFSLYGTGTARGDYRVQNSVIKITDVGKEVASELNILGIVQSLSFEELYNVMDQLGFVQDVTLNQTDFSFPATCSSQYMSIEIHNGIFLTLERVSP